MPENFSAQSCSEVAGYNGLHGLAHNSHYKFKFLSGNFAAIEKLFIKNTQKNCDVQGWGESPVNPKFETFVFWGACGTFREVPNVKGPVNIVESTCVLNVR